MSSPSPTIQMAPIPVGPDAVAAMSPSNYVTAETLREGDPAERGAIHLSSGDDKFAVGSWRAEPYAEFIESYPCDEYTRVLEGSITLTRGWRGEYRVTEPLVKQFAIYVS